jgi:hypothetical protein
MVGDSKWFGFQLATITTTPVDSSKFDFNIRLTIALQLLSDVALGLVAARSMG